MEPLSLFRDHQQEDEAQDGLFFLFLLTGLFFGVVFYDLLALNWVDELMALLLVIGYVMKLLIHRTVNNRGVFVACCISLFYLFYSFHIRSNTPNAILSDYASQIKPYIGFFCTFSILPQVTARQKRLLARCCLGIGVYLLLVGLGGESLIYQLMGHPSRFATTATITGILYLYCVGLTRHTCWQILLLTAVGFFSGRAKFFGFYVLFLAFMLMQVYAFRFRWRFRDFIIVLSLSAAVIFAGWEKINYYFIYGAFQSEEAFARPVLYYTSYSLFHDFFPFGCGLASFATFFSAQYYSPIYERYGIDQFYGLSEAYPDFIADSYYPALAQFGITGAFLFFLFWVYIFRKTTYYSKRIESELPLESDSLSAVSAGMCENPGASQRVILYSGIAFFLIESTSDTTFTHNRGFFLLIIMALCLSDLRTFSQPNLKSDNQLLQCDN